MEYRKMVELLSQRVGESQYAIEQMIGSLTEVLGEVTSEMDSVVLPSFGTFEPRKREERVGVHPASGKKLLLPPKIYLSFKPAAGLKQKIKK